MVKVGRILALGLGGLVLLGLLCAAGALSYRAYRQHELAPNLAITTPNGIDEHMLIDAGGIKQFITIRGQDRHNPIILFVHGGPAETHSYFPEIYQPWEKDFTIVQWDQRGAGRTYGANAKPPADLNLKQMTRDGVEVAAWVTHHLAQPKVILIGHSWGSILGVHMVRAQPSLFSAYVGTGQVESWNTTVAAQYAYSVEHAQARHDNAALAILKEIGPPPFKDLQTYIRFRQATRNDMAPSDAAFIARLRDLFLYAPRTSIFDYWDALNGGKAASALGPDMLAEDLPALGTDFLLPFFVIQGADDHVTPTVAAKAYFERIQAPRKGFLAIENAGHFAAMTKPIEFLDALKKTVLPAIAGGGAGDSLARP
ncbi:MAG: alpha/beta hydrolase [Alphaproteobacteria bacterium]